jgi:hypothetical protein
LKNRTARSGRGSLRSVHGRALYRNGGGLDQLRQALEPFVDRSLGVHDDLQLAVDELPHTALAGAERDHHALAVDPESVDDGEDLGDLVHSDRVEHQAASWPCRTSAGSRVPPA